MNNISSSRIVFKKFEKIYLERSYYDFTVIDGYNCPCVIIVAHRGGGKTFGVVKRCIEKFLTSEYNSRFVYICETGEMVKELARNNGEKFFCNLLEFYKECDTSRKKYFYEKLVNASLKSDNCEKLSDFEYKKTKNRTALSGSTIVINGETAGYILDLNSFGEIKRNNFVKVKSIIFDEFISEKLDKNSLDNPRKISSIIQSISRLNNVKCYLLGNTVRQDDPILSRMGFKLDKYGIYKYYNKRGELFCVLHFVDPNMYPKFKERHEESFAGQFAEMLRETHEEKNEFNADIPNDRRLKMPCKYKKNGFFVNVVRGDIIVSLKELQNGNIACVPFSNSSNTRTLFCLTEKEQGYKLGFRIMCNSNLRQFILNMLTCDIVYYYSEIEYIMLKELIKGV